jgi:hypothetical protein
MKTFILAALLALATMSGTAVTVAIAGEETGGGLPDFGR